VENQLPMELPLGFLQQDVEVRRNELFGHDLEQTRFDHPVLLVHLKIWHDQKRCNQDVQQLP
jgi:hypothetical protein